MKIVVRRFRSAKCHDARNQCDLDAADLRENLELRSNEQQVDFVHGQAVTHPAALRLNCSYLVTAWPVGGVDLALQEQRLLAQVLRVLSRYPTIPDNFLQGAMVGQDPPLPMVTLHPDALKNLAEFWSSLGSKLKASLTLTVTISVPVYPDLTDFIVTTMSVAILRRMPPADATARVEALLGGARARLPLTAALGLLAAPWPTSLGARWIESAWRELRLTTLHAPTLASLATAALALPTEQIARALEPFEIPEASALRWDRPLADFFEVLRIRHDLAQEIVP